jgi:hypothetical protein
MFAMGKLWCSIEVGKGYIRAVSDLCSGSNFDGFS